MFVFLSFCILSMIKAFSAKKMISILISMEMAMLCILMLWLSMSSINLFNIIIFFCTLICESSIGLSVLIMIINSKNPFGVSFSIASK